MKEREKGELERCLTSDDVPVHPASSGPRNVVDGLFAIAEALNEVALAIKMHAPKNT